MCKYFIVLSWKCFTAFEPLEWDFNFSIAIFLVAVTVLRKKEDTKKRQINSKRNKTVNNSIFYWGKTYIYLYSIHVQSVITEMILIVSERDDRFQNGLNEINFSTKKKKSIHTYTYTRCTDNNINRRKIEQSETKE